MEYPIDISVSIRVFRKFAESFGITLNIDGLDSELKPNPELNVSEWAYHGARI